MKDQTEQIQNITLQTWYSSPLESEDMLSD